MRLYDTAGPLRYFVHMPKLVSGWSSGLEVETRGCGFTIRSLSIWDHTRAAPFGGVATSHVEAENGMICLR